MSNHRRDVRPRYGRMAVLGVSLAVTTVAALAGLGVLGSGAAPAGAAARAAAYTPGPTATTTAPRADQATPPVDSGPTEGASSPVTSGVDTSDNLVAGTSQLSSTPGAASDALPAGSGSGRRVVFSQSQQRVWLVSQHDDQVQRTYLVSGSVTHNLQPGTYSVYSRSRWAVGVDDSGVMQYFVRFTQGPTGAAIGFHSIPTKNGVALQTKAQLGTAQSHGCIRQDLPDAIAMWNFAPDGTKVVVVA